jgi:LysM repeat protein
MFKKTLGLFTAAFMAAVGLVAIPVSAPVSVAAPNISAFDPGLIISDTVFFDSGSMALPQIQDFLDSRVADCRATDPALNCLKDYLSEIPETPATTDSQTGPCSAIPAKIDATAAEIIFAISNACGISPKVLLVTLQKEQGLISSTKPTSYMYRAAMGFGCPDSDPAICGKVFVGLFNQLYRAARQFAWYGNPNGSFTYWKPGRTVAMRFNPKSSCGTKSFELRSQATANLYYYTPYTPNDAAMNNLYGRGDSCSAYGNRNFWRFFHDWFGSPIAGGYLIKAAGSDSYLIVDDKKYRISDSRLIAALRPLGPLGEVSQSYLDSFTTLGDATQVIKLKDTGELHMLVDGTRYAVPSCEMAAQFGVDCNSAIELSAAQLNIFINGGTLTQLVQTANGTRYWVENGQSRVVVDDLALSSVAASGIGPTRMVIEQISSLTPGSALASELVMFGLAGSGDKVIAAGGKSYRFVASLVQDVGLSKWFKESKVTLSPQAIAGGIEPDTIRGFVKDSLNNAFVITENGKLRVADPANWTQSIVSLPDALLSAIPTSQGTLASPAMISSKGNRLSYFIQAGERRISSTQEVTTRFLNLINQPSVVEMPRSAINTVPNVGTAVAPGSVVRAAGTTQLFLVDDLNRKIPLRNSAQASSTIGTKTLNFSKSVIAGLETRAKLETFKVQCDGNTFLLDRGVLYPISAASAEHFPGTPYPLAISTCASMKLSERVVGQFIRDNKGILFFIEDGKKSRISGWAHFATLRGSGPGFVQATNFFSALIPTQGRAPAIVQLASFENPPNGDFGDFGFAGTIPEVVTPTPTPTTAPTPTTTPTPSPVPSQTQTPVAPEVSAEFAEYRVLSGDTLNSIGAKFGVSASLIQSFNSISNPRLIQIGQVLKIPTAAGTSSAAQQVANPEPVVEVERTYQVQSGDSLWGIARKFSVSSTKLAEANGINNPNFIRVGQTLIIPN